MIDNLQQAAKSGDAQAQFELGSMNQFGQAMQQDDEQALYWYKKAAEQGEARAQANLGCL